MKKILVLLLLLAVTSCAYMKHQTSGPESAQCQAYDDQYALWNSVALGAGSLGLPTGVTAIPVQSATAKDVMIGLAAGLGAIDVVSLFLANHAHSQYVELCDTSTVAAAATKHSLIHERDPFLRPAPDCKLGKARGGPEDQVCDARASSE